MQLFVGQYLLAIVNDLSNYQLNYSRIPKQWSPADGKGKKGRPRKNWKMTVTEDLKTVEMDWDEAEQAAENRLMGNAVLPKGTWKD